MRTQLSKVIHTSTLSWTLVLREEDDWGGGGGREGRAGGGGDAECTARLTLHTDRYNKDE